MKTRERAHYPAAFINAIAEEGTKAEAIEWLQKTWNELCEIRMAAKGLRALLVRYQAANYIPEDCDLYAETKRALEGKNETDLL